jgi:hypothetical protein
LGPRLCLIVCAKEPLARTKRTCGSQQMVLLPPHRFPHRAVKEAAPEAAEEVADELAEFDPVEKLQVSPHRLWLSCWLQLLRCLLRTQVQHSAAAPPPPPPPPLSDLPLFLNLNPPGLGHQCIGHKEAERWVSWMHGERAGVCASYLPTCLPLPSEASTPSDKS